MKRAIVIGLLLAAPVVSAQQLPDGPGAAIVKSRCVVCHESDIITQQHLSLAGWTRSIDKMVRWGSTITPQERETVQPYLADHFGPAPAASHANLTAGEATFKRACLTCHDADMAAQQHLSKAGWTRSVDKMIRWGAQVTDADTDALLEYLAASHPPR
jgi:mono/diheme cytochrome c family protein